MKYLKHLAAFSLMTSLLIGCGGGSSSSGITQYAGTYAGTLNVGMSSPTVFGDSPEFFHWRVNSDGTITDLIPDPNCSSTEAYIPKGESIEAIIVQQCTDPDLGLCYFAYEGSITFLKSNTGIFVQLSGDFACDKASGRVSTFGTLTRMQ